MDLFTSLKFLLFPIKPTYQSDIDQITAVFKHSNDDQAEVDLKILAIYNTLIQNRPIVETNDIDLS